MTGELQNVPPVVCPRCAALCRPDAIRCPHCGFVPSAPARAPWGPTADRPVVRSPWTVSTVSAAVGFSVLLGAVLVFLAPFLTFVTVSLDLGIGGGSVRYAFDGWGVYHASAGAGATHGHQPRWGIPLVLLALVALLSAGGIVFVADRPWPWTTAGLTGLAAGVLAVALGVQTESTASFSGVGQAYRPGPGTSLALIGCVLLALTAIPAARRSTVLRRGR